MRALLRKEAVMTRYPCGLLPVAVVWFALSGCSPEPKHDEPLMLPPGGPAIADRVAPGATPEAEKGPAVEQPRTLKEEIETEYGHIEEAIADGKTTASRDIGRDLIVVDRIPNGPDDTIYHVLLDEPVVTGKTARVKVRQVREWKEERYYPKGVDGKSIFGTTAIETHTVSVDLQDTWKKTRRGWTLTWGKVIRGSGRMDGRPHTLLSEQWEEVHGALSKQKEANPVTVSPIVIPLNDFRLDPPDGPKEDLVPLGSGGK